MAYNHGIGADEQATSVSTPVATECGLQVVIGTAPVNMVADPAGAVNKPFLCYSLAEAQAAVGYCNDFANYTLCESIYASFQVHSAAPIVLINVLDPSKHVKAVAAADFTVTNHAVTIEQTGVLPDTLVVKNGETTLVKDTDYTVTFETGTGYAIISLVYGTDAYSATTLGIGFSALDPSAVTDTDIIGGVDASTGAYTGIECVRQVWPKFNMTPGFILAPKYSHSAEVTAALNAKVEKLNGHFECEAVIDIDSSVAKTYTDVSAQKEAQGATNEHDINLWPKAGVGDYRLDYSALWAARLAQGARENDGVPARKVSNISAGATGAYLEDGTEIVMDETQANVLNAAGIVTLINDSGWKIWGNNTGCYPSNTDPKDRWIMCRLWFSWWQNSFIRTYKVKVDDPTNYRLVESLVDDENTRFASYAPDKIAGGYMEYDETVNTIENILAGHVEFKMHLAPYVPAEYIHSTLDFPTSILQEALEG